MRNKLFDFAVSAVWCAGLAALIGLFAIASSKRQQLQARVSTLMASTSLTIQISKSNPGFRSASIGSASAIASTILATTTSAPWSPFRFPSCTSARMATTCSRTTAIRSTSSISSVTADGKRIEPQVEVKATRFGLDVSELLKRHEIPLTMLAENDDATVALHEKLDDLPYDARQELERYGVIDSTTSSGADNKPLATTHWQTSITFYWFQTFPSERTIEVTHRYHPVPRHFFFSEENINSAEMERNICFDQAFANAARAMLKRASEGRGEDYSPILQGRELKYVLTTAENLALARSTNLASRWRSLARRSRLVVCRRYQAHQPDPFELMTTIIAPRGSQRLVPRTDAQGPLTAQKKRGAAWAPSSFLLPPKA